MDVDRPTTEEVDTISEGGSPPPKKKAKTFTMDPVKQLLGKAQTYLNADFVFYYKVQKDGESFETLRNSYFEKKLIDDTLF
jgi:hypothetical protein